jgi:hypothetical protein
MDQERIMDSDPLTPLELSWGDVLRDARVGPCLEADELIELAGKGGLSSASRRMQPYVQHVLSCSVCQDHLIALQRIERMRPAAGRYRLGLPLAIQAAPTRPLFRRRGLLLTGVALAGVLTVMLSGLLISGKLRPGARNFGLRQSQPAGDGQDAQNYAVQPRGDSQFVGTKPNPNGAAMGHRPDRPEIELIAPVMITRSQPLVLHWSSVPGATSYRVRVVDQPVLNSSTNHPVLEKTTATTACRFLPNSLRAGKSYRWTVEAYRGVTLLATGAAPLDVTKK